MSPPVMAHTYVIAPLTVPLPWQPLSEPRKMGFKKWLPCNVLYILYTRTYIQIYVHLPIHVHVHVIVSCVVDRLVS